MTPMPIYKRLKNVDSSLQIKPLTSRDREQFVHEYRKSQDRIPWTVNKARFGQNDMLGCIDTISYDPWEIILDQTSTIHHVSDKKREIQRMLHHSPEVSGIRIVVHGVDGYRIMQGKKWIPVITRHVEETWIDDEWEREEVPIDEKRLHRFDESMMPECNNINNNKDGSKIKSKVMENKKHSVKVVK